MFRRGFPFSAAAVFVGGTLALAQKPQQPAQFEIAGDWDVRVTVSGVASQTVPLDPPQWIRVSHEPHRAIPRFNPKAGGWAKGVQLKGVSAQETTSPHLLDPTSLVLRAGIEPDSRVFVKGVDYEADLQWGTFGIAGDNSAILPNQTVYATYRHAQMRLDAILLTAAGKVAVRQGEPRAAAPVVPATAASERHLGNIYLPRFAQKLEPEFLFPVLEPAYPEPPADPSQRNPTIARIKKRLESGQSLRILAWGDSVTDGSYLPNLQDRWQQQFVARLQKQFPSARIELLTQAWGGRNTGSYLAEPPGSPHNYRETVLALKPDVIVSEFVNDAGLNPAQVEERYSRLLADFQQIGAQWIILTPHYVRPDWMNLTRERDIDDDPRAYVEGLRLFAARHSNAVALADASLRYGRLWRQGIPYNTLMLNAINHPDARGMRLFADALIALFRN
jgi:lysophospholipase L1-like esterase